MFSVAFLRVKRNRSRRENPVRMGAGFIHELSWTRGSMRTQKGKNHMTKISFCLSRAVNKVMQLSGGPTMQQVTSWARPTFMDPLSSTFQHIQLLLPFLSFNRTSSSFPPTCLCLLPLINAAFFSSHRQLSSPSGCFIQSFGSKSHLLI